MGRPTKTRFRRSPHLICYWSGGKFVFANYATNSVVAAEPLTCQILNYFDRWRPADELAEHLARFTPASVRRTVAQLARHSLLQSSRQPRSQRQIAMDDWRGWNPAAGFFHFSTRDTPFTTDWDYVERYLREKAKRVPFPSLIKHYPKSAQIRLPGPEVEGEFPQVLLRRRTWRWFSRRSLTLSSLGTLLGLTWKVQRWIEAPLAARLPLKTSPSGGALHPIEVYVLVLRVAGLPRGLYHYAADRHRLELLKHGANPRQATDFLSGQTWFGSAAALMLMTAVFPRVQWRYEFPRAYRAVLLEAGHFCQTFCLVATWLGLAPFCTMALADSLIEKALGVDGVSESVLYAAGVGGHPGGNWSPWPPSTSPESSP